jgi:HEAT repeat protein
MRSAWTFFEKVLQALQGDHRLQVLWGFGVLFLIVLIAVLVLGDLPPGMQLAAIVFIVFIPAYLFVYTVPRLPQHSTTLPPIERLKANLDSPNAIERIEAVKALEQSSDPVAREALVQATQHHFRDVRIEAAFALARLQDKHAVSPLINLLHDEQKRSTAEDAIVQLGELAIHDLVATLGGDNATQQKRVLGLLGRIRNCGDEVMSSLTNALHAPDREVRYAVIDTLGQIGAQSGCRVAVLQLVEIAQRTDADKAMRSAAIKALGQIKNRDAVPGLIEVLRDPDLEICKMVIDTLGKIGGSEAVLRLGEITQRTDADKAMRSAAIKALGQTRDPDAVPGLKRILQDIRGKQYEDIKENSCIIVNAGKALREIGTPDTLAFLKEIRDHIPSQHMVDKIWDERLRNPRGPFWLRRR